MIRIPLVDLARQYTEIAEELQTVWNSVIERADFILGHEVAGFEDEFARYCRNRFCIGVANGTDAIELSLRAVGIGPGMDVLLPANTFIATALAVLRAGAEVVLVDCDPDTYLIDIEAASARRTSRSRAVIPVHLFGQMAACDELGQEFKDIVVIEDAAQAQGARRYGRSIGSFGVMAATSFYPGKNLGAFGDAGAVLTNEPDIAAKLRSLRNWGSDRKYHHPEVGFNSRLDTLQAAVLSAKLRHLDRWNEERVKAAAFYGQMLDDRVKLPHTLPGNDHVYHLYVVELDDRDTVMGRMHEAGIGVGVHYPIPLHLQGALSHLGHRNGDFPNAESAAARMLSLPIFPGITESEQEEVVETLFKAMK